MIYLEDFQQLIVRPTLRLISAWSPNAEMLLLGTALIESNLTFLQQHKGPALGLYQIEPATYDALLVYLKRPENAKLKQSILSACWIDSMPDAQALIYNLRFATCMARVFYMRFEEPLPEYDDLTALANYYKKYYNTAGGAALPAHFVDMLQGVTIDET